MKIEIPVKPQVFTGNAVLNLEAGTILLAIEGSNKGNYVVRTDSDKNPLFGLTDGVIWGSNLSLHSFTIIDYPLTISNE